MLPSTYIVLVAALLLGDDVTARSIMNQKAIKNFNLKTVVTKGKKNMLGNLFASTSHTGQGANNTVQLHAAAPKVDSNSGFYLNYTSGVISVNGTAATSSSGGSPCMSLTLGHDHNAPGLNFSNSYFPVTINADAPTPGFGKDVLGYVHAAQQNFPPGARAGANVSASATALGFESFVACMANDSSVQLFWRQVGAGLNEEHCADVKLASN